MSKVLSCGAILLLVSGCAAQKTWTPTLGKNPQDFVSDMNGCIAEADKLPVTQVAIANPLFAAASQEEFKDHCMAAKGWRVSS